MTELIKITTEDLMIINMIKYNDEKYVVRRSGFDEESVDLTFSTFEKALLEFLNKKYLYSFFKLLSTDETLQEEIVKNTKNTNRGLITFFIFIANSWEGHFVSFKEGKEELFLTGKLINTITDPAWPTKELRFYEIERASLIEDEYDDLYAAVFYNAQWDLPEDEEKSFIVQTYIEKEEYTEEIQNTLKKDLFK